MELKRKRGIGTVVALLLLLLLLCSCVSDVVGAKKERAFNPEALLTRALQYRDKPGATAREQKIAAGLLREAAGLVAAKSASGKGGKAVPVPGFPDLAFTGNSHPAALRELAKCYQRGKGVDIDHKLSLELFRRAAELGDSEAQGALAMRMAVGLHHTNSFDGAGIRHFSRPDESAAILNYYFAAAAGDHFAGTALGYRHTYGLGVPKSCWSAVSYYKPVAEAVVQESLQGAPDGPIGSTSGRGLPQIERIRLNVHANQGIKPDRQREVLQYYQYSADRGNSDAQTAVGTLLNFGLHGVSRDHMAAAQYLQRAAAAGNAEAQAHLGHMYGAGLGVKQDFDRARSFFEDSRPHPLGLYGLGYMYLAGKGVQQDHEKAFSYLSKAAEQGDRDANFYLGAMYMHGLGMKRRSMSMAFRYYYQAAKLGHVQAMYNTAVMHLAGKGTLKNCKLALDNLKSLVEKGPLAAALQAGHEAFYRGHHSQALLLYLQAAEMGMELGQSNAAWMIDRGFTHAGPQASAVATMLFKRSAEQGNVMSLLQLGDCFYYGTGVEQDWVRASAIYYEAYKERSPEAMFNLGFMHQFGAGVPQDFDLAKRFYEMSRHSNADAALPVYLAKTWLRVHAAWSWLRPRLPLSVAAPINWMFELRPSPSAVRATVSSSITSSRTASSGGGGSAATLAAGSAPALASLQASGTAGQGAAVTPGAASAGSTPAATAAAATGSAAAGKGAGAVTPVSTASAASGGKQQSSGGSATVVSKDYDPTDEEEGEEEADYAGSGWLWWLPTAPARLLWQWDSLVWRLAEATGLAGLSITSFMEEYSDVGETLLLLVLLCVLVLVLRIRRQRQQALENRVLAALQQPGEQQQLAQQIAAQLGLHIPAQQPQQQQQRPLPAGRPAAAAGAAAAVRASAPAAAAGSSPSSGSSTLGTPSAGSSMRRPVAEAEGSSTENASADADEAAATGSDSRSVSSSGRHTGSPQPDPASSSPGSS